MIIYGAGMAGLLAGQMLRRFEPEIREAQSDLPNNHEALLRFRTDAVSRVIGIPFKKVRVDKAISYHRRLITVPNLKLSNLYSLKVTGEVVGRSIMNLEPVERYIAPLDLIPQMARGLNIRYSMPLTKDEAIVTLNDRKEPLISTVPMPVLMKIMGWDQMPEFKYRGIWSLWTTVIEPGIDVYQTIYYPDPQEPYYRASICGDRIIIEYISEPQTPIDDLYRIAIDFGIPIQHEGPRYEPKFQPYGKLLPIDNGERKRFILAMTDLHRIYSLGRFGTWRQILMDDVVQDIRLIEGWVTERDTYVQRLHKQGE